MDHHTLTRKQITELLWSKLPIDYDDMKKKYKIGNIRQRKNGLALRVVGDELPDEAVKVEDNINLEDVYLYYFE